MAERSQIEEIKERLDIVDVASKYIRSPIKRTGRNTFTICPFHNEKTPSFSLNSDLGIYKCFGCGESGDVIKLIEKLDGVDFPKALEIAADYAGIKLKEIKLSPQDIKLKEEREKAAEAHSLAAEFFHYLLINHKAGKPALDYCYGRKIRLEELKLFKIGYAPKGFENLKKYLLKKNFKEGDLIKWGLLVSKNGKVYDKFRNRLMFPIFNHRGEIVGFSGRTLEKDGIPKYLNSPESVLYRKSDVVYGLFQAKDSMRKSNFAIIAEGNVEPLTSRKANIENLVVPMGTAMTIPQLKLIKRYCDSIYFAFDTDAAGFNALQRTVKLASPLGFNMKVINLGKFKDPDEMLYEDPRLWMYAVENASDIMDFMINKFARNLNVRSGQGKSQFVKQISPFMNLLSDPIQKEHYTKVIAEMIQLDFNTVKEAIKNNQLKPEDGKKETKQKEGLTQKDYLISLVLHYPKYLEAITSSDISFSDLQKKIIEQITNDLNVKEIRNDLDEKGATYFDELVMNEINFDDDDKVEKTVNKLVAQIKKKQTKDKVSNIKSALRLGEEDDEALLTKLNAEVKIKRL